MLSAIFLRSPTCLSSKVDILEDGATLLLSTQQTSVQSPSPSSLNKCRHLQPEAPWEMQCNPGLLPRRSSLRRRRWPAHALLGPALGCRRQVGGWEVGGTDPEGQDIPIQTPQFSRNQRGSVTWQRAHSKLETELGLRLWHLGSWSSALGVFQRSCLWVLRCVCVSLGQGGPSPS